MNHIAVMFVFAAAAACGGSQPKTSTAAASGTDCKAAARKLAADSTVQDKDAYASSLESRCHADKWSDEARACLVEKGEAGPCVLADQQRAGIEQERARAFEQAVKTEESAGSAAP